MVAKGLYAPPILMGHSIGGLAILKYAEQYPTAALVAIASVVPAEAGAPASDFAFESDQPYLPPPFKLAHRVFFDGLTEADARLCNERLHPISQRRMYEGANHILHVDKGKITVPGLAVSGEWDPLCPASVMQSMSEYYDFDYVCKSGRGHNLPLEPNWRGTAEDIASWLDQKI